MLKCIIIDDEPLAIDLLTDYVSKSDELKLIKSFTNPIKALQEVDQLKPDVIFLDVQMPELSGIQFIKITNQKYSVILTTAYEDYAVKGYEYDVVDYLVKPISFDRFLIAVNKTKLRFPATEAKSELSPPSDSNPDYIFIKTSYKTIRLDYSDIKYLEGLGDYIAVHTDKGKHLTLESLRAFESSLPINQFMRVHKSYIINISAIEYIERNRVIIGEKRIPIGGSYQKEFWAKIGS